jgi:hypothetical protein
MVFDEEQDFYDSVFNSMLANLPHPTTDTNRLILADPFFFTDTTKLEMQQISIKTYYVNVKIRNSKESHEINLPGYKRYNIQVQVY